MTCVCLSLCDCFSVSLFLSASVARSMPFSVSISLFFLVFLSFVYLSLMYSCLKESKVLLVWVRPVLQILSLAFVQDPSTVLRLTFTSSFPLCLLRDDGNAYFAKFRVIPHSDETWSGLTEEDQREFWNKMASDLPPKH